MEEVGIGSGSGSGVGNGKRESSEGTKRVAETGNMMRSEEAESMFAQLLKSPAPIRASIMLLS